ncbi:FecCD family ABC transporter permease [Salinibacter ruber]|uniref:Iron complex transport system permease protein n=1 Tax=Salinibacter ruber TaxID=146919 RepID=A0A9X2U5P4_9BACT|nr:iron ABC transporter permease [Salinibacter ruber]MCS3656131.1 iron complex transport system permease protein [Salinibacter ruber]MCS3668913.1 iron complex transport system permease protein [Salinibacter ruber]MCS3950357.1 iron complex transport system permease protein [Salinibacter ruber]MCS4117119.1 iron complex transport system permease protein [Salinibacter ruber]MCS4153959.1 iron complex transport system permease protein [Salinibacter ruber]
MDFSAVTTNSGTDTRTDAREGPRPSGAASSRRARQRGREWRVLTGLVALLLGAVAAGLAVGAVAISPGQVLAILGDKVGLTLPWSYEHRQALVLTAIRLPRVLLGVGVGGGLAVSGAVMQGLFRNPLADPSLIGVSSGAALAAVVTIVLGSTLFGAWGDTLGAVLLPAAAFAGGVGATVVVYRLGTRNGQTSVATMLLAGIAINALAGAGTGLMTFIADDDQLRDLTFWTLGSLGGATWTQLAVVGPCLLGGMIAAPFLARPLNALLLGEGEAYHLGINIERTKKLVVTLAALVVGAAVAVSGVIGFIGLVVPHLLRLAVGPDHRVLIPGSALLGGALLLGADVLARTIVTPAELPIGIVTALVGAPFFLWLLLRDRTRGAGYSF